MRKYEVGGKIMLMLFRFVQETLHLLKKHLSFGECNHLRENAEAFKYVPLVAP